MRRDEELTPEELEKWWRESLAVKAEEPVFAAMVSMIEVELEFARETVGSVLVAEKHGALAHAAGGQAYLTNLLGRIKKLRRQAMGEEAADDDGGGLT